MIEFKVEGRPVPQPRPRVYRTASGKSKAVNSRQSINYKRIVKYAALSEMNKQQLTMTDRPLAMRLTVLERDSIYVDMLDLYRAAVLHLE